MKLRIIVCLLVFNINLFTMNKKLQQDHDLNINDVCNLIEIATILKFRHSKKIEMPFCAKEFDELEKLAQYDKETFDKLYQEAYTNLIQNS